MTRGCGEGARYGTTEQVQAASYCWPCGRQTEAASSTSAGDAASVTRTDSGGVAVRDDALQHLGATLRFIESARQRRCEPILEEPVGVLLDSQTATTRMPSPTSGT
jgi:hypothetical protein